MDEQFHNVEQLQQMFRHITVWKRGAERAPHKPLLLLYALGKCQRGAPRALPYAEVDPALQRLLRAFGPPRQSYHSEYPFWRLQQGGIWELQGAEHVVPRQSNNDAKKKANSCDTRLVVGSLHRSILYSVTIHGCSWKLPLTSWSTTSRRPSTKIFWTLWDSTSKSRRLPVPHVIHNSVCVS